MSENFQWVQFLFAITLLTMTPGQDTFMVIRNATRGGWRDGILTSLGICCGLFVHASVSAAGLSMILLGSTQFFAALQFAGSLYLAWLGYQNLNSAWFPKRLHIQGTEFREISPWVSMQEGFLSNVLNPKPIIFYMAFLPQFMDSNKSPLLQSMFMAGLHFTIANVWQGILVVLVNKARQWLSTPAIVRTLDGLAGLLFLCLACKLAVSQL